MVQQTCWVESLGGPLIVVPVSALTAWTGSANDHEPDDYDRACKVDGLAGVIPVGDALGLVLADDPATTCYLPEYRAFLRWLAADTETDLLAAAEATLADPDAEWEERGVWETDGPAVLMDSVTAGHELAVEYPDGGGLPEQAPVAITAGQWRVRVHHQEAESAWFELVQLLAVIR